MATTTCTSAEIPWQVAETTPWPSDRAVTAPVSETDAMSGVWDRQASGPCGIGVSVWSSRGASTWRVQDMRSLTRSYSYSSACAKKPVTGVFRSVCAVTAVLTAAGHP